MTINSGTQGLNLENVFFFSASLRTGFNILSCLFFLFLQVVGTVVFQRDSLIYLPFPPKDNFPRHILSLAPHEANVFSKQLEMFGVMRCALGRVPHFFFFFFFNCV